MDVLKQAFDIPVVGQVLKVVFVLIVVLFAVNVLPMIIKIFSKSSSLANDGKVALEIQKVRKRINDYNEQIGTLIIENSEKISNAMFIQEIEKIKENMMKIEEKEAELAQIKGKK